MAIAQLTLPSVLYFFFVVKPLDLDLLVQYSFTWFISNFLPACVLLTVLGLYLPRHRRRQRRKQAGLVRHCVAAFSRYAESSASGRKKQAEVARKLSDRELFWAYALPDHSPSGERERSAGTRTARPLARRTYLWKPDPSELTAPGAVDSAISPSEYVALSVPSNVISCSTKTLVFGASHFWRSGVCSDSRIVSQKIRTWVLALLSG